MEGSTVSRRHAFKIAGLAGAAVALGDRMGLAETPATNVPAMPQGAGFYRTHVGEFEVTIVSDGQFPLTPYPTIGSNAKQADVEAILADNFIKPNELMAQVNTLTIRRGNGPVIVVDTGSGKLFGPAAGFAKQNLIASGVRPEDVQTVVFTHLHPDHVGGALDETGKLAFPKAKFHVHADEIAFWKNPDFSKSGVPESARAGMAAAAQKFITAAGDALTAFAGDTHEIAPGVTAVKTGGHTPGHCVIGIEDGNAAMMYVTDLIVQSLLVPAHPEWYVGFDTDMAKTVEVRMQTFARLAADRTMIGGAHLPFPSVGHLKTDGTGYAYVPAPWRWA